MRGSCTPSGGWAVRSTVGRRTSSRWSDRGSQDRSPPGLRTRDDRRKLSSWIVRLERKFAEADRKRKKGLLFPEELRRLEDGVQIADRVFLLPDRPLSVEVDDRGEDVLQRHVRLEGMPDGLFPRRRLVPHARLERREHGGSVLIFGLPEPQELRIPESGREGSIQLPGEPCVLRSGEESAREARRVHFGQGVAEKPWLRARRDEQGPVRFIGPPFEGERLQDRLDTIELPFLEERGQGVCVRVPAVRWSEGRNLGRRDSLETHGLHISEVRQGHEAAWETEDRRDVRVADRKREVVAEAPEVVEGGADRQVGGRLDAMVECDSGEEGSGLRTHALEHELAVGERLILLGRGRNRVGGRLDLGRDQGPFRQTEVVKDEEPEETQSAGRPCEPKELAACVDRQDAVRRVELGVVVVRYDGQEFLQDRPRGRGVLRDIVEEPNALLMFECREESEEALEVLRCHASEESRRGF